MTEIVLDKLVNHPDNANRMPPPLLEKLAEHIQQTGQYPPLIVRVHPDREDHYQILDGQHRAEVLRQLGHTTARCDVWQVDDEQAAMLLLTLNRLQGTDDPQLRGSLLERLSQTRSVSQLAKLVPEDAARIRRLIEVSQPPPPLVEPPNIETMPEAITFFLTAPQRRSLLKQLRAASKNRSEALVKLLSLDDETVCSEAENHV